MHMVRQNNPSIDMKWQPTDRAPDRLSQSHNLRDEQVRATVAQIDRKEIAPACNPVSAIIWHSGTIPLSNRNRKERLHRRCPEIPPRRTTSAKCKFSSRGKLHAAARSPYKHRRSHKSRLIPPFRPTSPASQRSSDILVGRTTSANATQPRSPATGKSLRC
jgi:hypothetical protein